MKINCRGKLLDLSKPVVMGIINITPDSFFEDSRCLTSDDICAKAEQHIKEGATILDLGGFSTRPGAKEVSVEEETERMCMAVASIRKNFSDIVISVDTFRANVAKTCIEECGADIINDISGGNLDEQMFDVVGELRIPYILTHTRGENISEMQQNWSYNDITKDIFRYFAEKTRILNIKGVNDIIIDPGFGFAKDINQNYELMAHSAYLKQLGHPLLIGVSRKRMVWQVIGSTAAESLNGTTALNMLALTQGANILRVHDVKAATEAVKIFNIYKEKESSI